MSMSAWTGGSRYAYLLTSCAVWSSPRYCREWMTHTMGTVRIDSIMTLSWPA
jgi:hypothetical protein